MFTIHALRTLYRLMTRARRRHLAVTLSLMFCGVAAELLTIGAALFFLALAADPAAAPPAGALRNWLGLADGVPLIGAASLLAAAAIAAAGLRLALAWASHSFVMKLGHELAAAIFSRVIHQPYSEHLRRNSSEILSAVEKVQVVIHQMLQPVMQAVIAGTMALFILAFLFFIDPVLASFGSAGVALAYVGMNALVRHRVQSNSALMARMMTLRTQTVQEALGGIRDIILEQSQDLFEEKFRTIDRLHRRAALVNGFIVTSPRYLLEGAGIVAITLVTLIFSLKAGGILAAIPEIGALSLGAQRLLPLVQQAWQGWSNAGGNAQALADVAALIGAPVEEKLAAHSDPLSFQDAIVFDHVSFGHEGGHFKLRDICLRIERGSRVAIIGPTGSGKSTVLDLLMGLLGPTEGGILIDGCPLDARTRRSWQAAVAHVPQSIYLSDDTIAANIAFATRREMDFESVQQAARAACLDDFLRTLPHGLNTRVGERGIRLSGGQRQRIGIARALYRRTALLILDEATSALDHETEAAVMSSITKHAAGITLVVVAHRVSTTEGFDSIFVLDSGSCKLDRKV